uniref:Uncharacterized protein n=1 Tax=Knipowitschia caucasica TaxID=637954 RepID=A0AAV2M824_KNICA
MVIINGHASSSTTARVGVLCTERRLKKAMEAVIVSAARQSTPPVFFSSPPVASSMLLRQKRLNGCESQRKTPPRPSPLPAPRVHSESTQGWL